MSDMAPEEATTFALNVESYRVAAGINLSQLSLQTGIARTPLRRKIARPGLFTVDELTRVRICLSIPREVIEAAL